MTLLPWKKQLSGKICCPALLLTTWEKNRFHWRQHDMRSPKSPSVWQLFVDGIKLKPFIVFAGATRETKQLNEEFKNKCYAASSVNGWMNEDLARDWLQGTLGKFLFTCWITAWDFFKCHITDSIKQELAQTKIDPVIVPGGCTKYIQAPDVAWN